METRKPIHDVTIGNTRAAVWANRTDNGAYLCVTVGTQYQNGGRWKTSSSIDFSDLPDAVAALEAALSWQKSQAASPVVKC